MSKLPSVETQLKRAKADLKKFADELSKMTQQKEEFRIRATKAEQGLTEWKQRFDILLSREPK